MPSALRTLNPNAAAIARSQDARHLEIGAQELLDIASSPDEEVPGGTASANTGGASIDHRERWGATVTLQFGAVSADPTKGPASQALITPYFRNAQGQVEERDCTVIFQETGGVIAANQGGAGGLNNNITICVINYQIGAVLMTKTFAVLSNVQRFVQITASQVQVYFYVANPAAALIPQTTLNVAVISGHYAGGMFYGWSMANDNGNAKNLLVNTAGVLGWASITMTAAGPATSSAPLYLCGYDKLTAPGALYPPIPGFVSPPLTGQNATATIGDDTAPGAIGWSNGLYYALSTNPASYAAPTGSPTVNLQVKYGQ